jgi:hypothetical protein
MSAINRSTASMRLFGFELDPAYITQVLGCEPSSAARRGDRISKPEKPERIATRGFWHLEYGNADELNIEAKIEVLLEKLTNDLAAWREATKDLDVADIYCGLFLDDVNEGFTLSPSLLKKIADRNLKIGFDIYSSPNSWDDENEEVALDSTQ